MTRESDQPVDAVQPLFGGPIDIVGDVHGEWVALRSLLSHLGYDQHGEHRGGRRLVFVGDLCDRGPDSPRVFEFVAGLVDRGLAQCVLGNHELNLLRQERKRGNGWYFAQHPDHDRAEFRDARRVGERARDAIRAFCASLPLALERADLRVTHAAWHGESIDALRRSAPVSHLDRYRGFEQQVAAALEGELGRAVHAEMQRWGDGLHDARAAVPLLPALATADESYQMGNPLRVVTSGVERVAARSYYASGKWRMVQRLPWWEEYRDDPPVVVGHYWRWISAAGQQRYAFGAFDLFAGIDPLAWLGDRRRVFCVDYSVGARFREILDGHEPGTYTRLAALRWPERELVTETGERLPA